METTVHLTNAGRVRLQYEATLPAPISAAWQRLRNFERCSCLDFFHRDVQLPGPPAPGLRFALPHRVFGLTIERHGEILRWREGRGWAFSDLSKKGPRRGFPHVFTAELEPLDEDRCRLDLTITGLWTARWLPRSWVRPWLRLNVHEIGTALARELSL